jgi:hypothetical protein
LNTAASVSGTLVSFWLAGQLAVETLSVLVGAPSGAEPSGVEIRVIDCGLLLLFLPPILQVYKSPPSAILASGSERTMLASFDAEKPVESDAAARLAASTPIDAAAASTTSSIFAAAARAQHAAR